MYENLTGKILEYLFELFNEVGIGLNKVTYHRALAKRKGFPCLLKTHGLGVEQGYFFGYPWSICGNSKTSGNLASLSHPESDLRLDS